MITWNSFMSVPCDSLPELSLHALKQWQDSKKAFSIIDVRQPEEYAAGHMNAQNIPLDELADQLGDLDPAACYVVHCKLGPRGRRAVALMQEAGFTDVHHLTGGYVAWHAAQGDA
jgi:rhodanese-related sulfurtransferase